MTDALPPEDWPFRSHSQLIACKPHRWHVQVMGEGPDILLIHGAGASGHSWFRLAPILAETHRVILVDLPGHGWTQSPRGRGRLSDVAEGLAALMTSQGWSPRTLIGHSAGAAIALELVRGGWIEPDRVVSVNGALESFQGPAGWMFPMMARMLALNPFVGAYVANTVIPMAHVRRFIGATGSELDTEALRYYRTLLGRRAHVDGTVAMMAQWDLDGLAAHLPKIDVPVLLLHGALDQAVRPQVSERAQAVLPKAELQILPELGHLAHEEAPEVVASAITAFLQQAEPA